MPVGGFSYQPGSQDSQLPPNGQQRGQGAAPQQAIRTLNLRVPQTQSVPGVAPLPLLNARGGGGSDLDMLLAALLKAFGPGAMTGGGQPETSIPRPKATGAAPRITPGTEEIRGDLTPVNILDSIPKDRAGQLGGMTGGNTGIGNTGRPMGQPSPLPGADFTFGNDEFSPFPIGSVQPLF